VEPSAESRWETRLRLGRPGLGCRCRRPVGADEELVAVDDGFGQVEQFAAASLRLVSQKVERLLFIRASTPAATTV